PSLYLLPAALIAQGFELLLREQLDRRTRTGDQQFKHLNSAAGSLNLLARALGKAVRLDGEGCPQLTATEDHHRVVGVTHQANRRERLGRDLRPRLEAILKLVHVYFLVVRPEDVRKAALKRQATHERKLATLKVRRNTAARAGILALGTATGCLAMARAMAATYSLALFRCTLIGTQVVQLHLLTPLLRQSPGARSWPPYRESAACWASR